MRFERDGSVAIDTDHLDGIDPAVYARRWKTLAVLCASLIIVIVGNTVLNVALPTLQLPASDGGIGASNTDIQWIVDAYGLVFAGLLFTAAALGDRFGRKGALQAGLVIFGLGSLLGVFADTSGAADRLARHHGRRRRVRHAVDAVDPRQRLPGP